MGERSAAKPLWEFACKRMGLTQAVYNIRLQASSYSGCVVGAAGKALQTVNANDVIQHTQAFNNARQVDAVLHRESDIEKG